MYLHVLLRLQIDHKIYAIIHVILKLQVGGLLRLPPAAPVLYIPSHNYIHCMQYHESTAV